MQIELLEENHSIPNKTRKYLKPYMYSLPVWQWLKKIPMTFIACGIIHREIEGFFYLVQIDRDLPELHEDIIQTYYVGELGFGNLHMIQIRFPHDLINLFKQGKYSKLYSNPEKVLALVEDNWIRQEENILNVLKKDKNYKILKEQELSSPHSPVTIGDAELDSIPSLRDESFDHD